jgi:hypothetical protein
MQTTAHAESQYYKLVYETLYPRNSSLQPVEFVNKRLLLSGLFLNRATWTPNCKSSCHYVVSI